jgi:hypothetical protein
MLLMVRQRQEEETLVGSGTVMTVFIREKTGEMVHPASESPSIVSDTAE